MEKKTVVEFALVEGSGDNEQGLFSSSSEMMARMEATRHAHAGKSLDTLRLVKRTATYPLDKKGVPQATGSTVDTEELPL